MLLLVVVLTLPLRLLLLLLLCLLLLAVLWCRYGEDLLKTTKPMHVLWSGNHYDLLIPQTVSRL
jgi:hypothetical protein